MLSINKLKGANRNTKCYGNRNTLCYDLGFVNSLLLDAYKKSVTICYGKYEANISDYKRVKCYRNTKKRNTFLLLNRRWVRFVKKTVIILKAMHSGAIYRKIGADSYLNLSTGMSGLIKKEIVAKHLVLPVVANMLLQKNQRLLKLIEEFKCEIINK
jgi:hypothetical protein